jgi:hypothetical protein
MTVNSLFEENPFYHGTIRNLIVAMGTLFTGITITRQDSNKKKVKSIKVPIAYGPKHKWLNKLREDADFKKNVEIVLPRLSFEIVDYKYDPTRKIGVQGNFTVGDIGGVRAKVFNPVPYDVTIQVHSMCKNQEDSLQIFEQVAPYFAPSMTVNMIMLPEFNIKKDVPLLFQGATIEDSYDGSAEEFRTVIQTFNFVAQLDLFGPIIKSDKIIKTSIANVASTIPAVNETPNAGNTYTAKVDPKSANKTDTYTINEDWLNNF